MNPVIELNLDNLSYNYTQLNKKFPRFWAVLKDNAYGLGISNVSKSLYASGCRKFLVADLEEAIAIKDSLNVDDVEIAILSGFFNSEEAKFCVEHNFIPFINNRSQIEIWKNLQSDADVAVFLETGLNRFSLREEDLECLLLNTKGNIRLAISHLACARNKDHIKNLTQKRKFDDLCHYIEKHKKIIEKSLCSSEGVANLDKSFLYDSVRLGSALYGFSKDINNQFELKNLMSFSAPIIKKIRLKKGDCLGYGDHNVLAKDATIAILNLGLANGLYRSMANKNSMFIKNNNKMSKLPIISDITMEYTTIDISEASFLEEGDYVYLFDYETHIKDNMDDFNYEDVVHKITSSERMPYHKEFTLSLQTNKNNIIYTRKGG